MEGQVDQRCWLHGSPPISSAPALQRCAPGSGEGAPRWQWLSKCCKRGRQTPCVPSRRDGQTWALGELQGTPQDARPSPDDPVCPVVKTLSCVPCGRLPAFRFC